jgi:hypothetical protein
VIAALGYTWIGYTLIWYGVKLIQGPGIGILDVISPSRISKMDSKATSAQGAAQSVQGGINTNYSQALQSMGPATPPLPSAFTPGMASGAQANYGQALQSMQP